MTRRRNLGVYARLYVSILRNAKHVERSDLAWRLYVSALVWCRDEGNDGHVPEGALVACVPGRLRAKLIAAARELEGAGLWDTEIGGGWQIHDYDEHQDVAAVIQTNQNRKRDAARARWEGEPEPLNTKAAT